MRDNKGKMNTKKLYTTTRTKAISIREKTFKYTNSVITDADLDEIRNIRCSSIVHFVVWKFDIHHLTCGWRWWHFNDTGIGIVLW